MITESMVFHIKKSKLNTKKLRKQIELAGERYFDPEKHTIIQVKTGSLNKSEMGIVIFSYITHD